MSANSDPASQWRSTGTMAQISVHDTGIGIEMEDSDAKRGQ
nr:hypothetical protein [Nostoc sp. ChiQUE02]MDZ8233611.1 hypothetical protein [Nostoc sp. ChiQUE02]